MSKQVGTISERLWNDGQSWHYQWIGIAGSGHGRKFKVEICRNGFDNQSYARAYIYDPVHSDWKLIVFAPITECECKWICSSVFPPGHPGKNPQPTSFHDDRARLLTEAITITH